MSRLTFVVDGFTPDWKVHPGRTLHEVLREFGMTQVELAAQCGVSQKHISRVITGKAGIGPMLALALERVTHVSADFWARLQAQYDVADARQRAQKPDPILTYTDPAGGPDWEPRGDEA